MRRADRKDVNFPVEFYVDADIVKASSIDLSETGMGFVTDSPIKVRVRVYDDDIKAERIRTAELVWARRDDNAEMRYGIEFVD